MLKFIDKRPTERQNFENLFVEITDLQLNLCKTATQK